MELTSSYNLPLVSFSVLIAVLASYTALELTERISRGGKIKIGWLIGSSLTMGTGIWSMHFVGMLAYSLSVPVSYDLTTVIVSWCLAIIVSGVAFYSLHRGLNGMSLVWAGTLMGSGIGGMQYIGMGAMGVPAKMEYDYFIVAVSVVFAIILSSVSLATANYVTGYLEREELKLGSSFLIGAAISCLHYIGMAAANFTLTKSEEAPSFYGGVSLTQDTPTDGSFLDLETNSLAYTITIVTILIIAGAFMACMKAQKQEMSQRLKKSSRILKQVNKELEIRVAARTIELQKAKEATEKQNIKLKKAKKALEEVCKSKDIFLANISHELRTPLNSILGYATLLQRDSNLNASQIKDLAIVKQSGTHLLNLINEILDLSKTNAAKLELNPKLIRLQSFLDGVIGIGRISATETGLLVKLDTQGNLPVNIKADPKRLRQILINLLSNAVKFTFSGEVTLKVTVLGDVEKSTQDISQQKLRFEVIDTGIGMNSEQLEKIFKPFEQFGDIESRTAGTGLGLSLSQQLVQLMGSELKVKSQLGSGSTFWFDLVVPVIDTPSLISRKTVEEVQGYQGRRRKVLVVDDQEVNRDLLVQILQPRGFEIETTHNGVEMLSLAFSMKPDLILLDLFMPAKTGFTAVKEIRGIPELKDIIIIITSASSISPEMKNYLQCEAYLGKPINEEKLLKLLQEYLGLEWIYRKAS